MKTYDLVVMRSLVKESVPASELYHDHKTSLQEAGPKGKGNRRQFSRECEKKAYKAAYDEIRDEQEHEQLRTKYDAIYDRIEQSYRHKP